MAQPLRNITISAPGFAGINTMDSPISIGEQFCLVAENAVIDQFGRIAARKGYELKTDNPSVLGSSVVGGIFEYLDTAGNVETIVTANNSIFTGDTTLTDITPSGVTITGDNWKGVTFNGYFFLFQDSHNPMFYDGTNIDLISNSGSYTGVPAYSGTVPQGNEVIAAFGRLWAVDANRNIIHWSDLLNGFSWDTGSAGSINLNKVWGDQSDRIEAIAAHNGFLIIFGTRQILVYSGPQDPATMALEDTILGVGCIARDSVQYTGNDLIFLADSGVRSFNRVVQEKSLPMRDISKNVRSDLMTLALSQTFPIKSAYSEDEAFYLLILPTSNAVYCFDMRTALQDGSHRATLWTGLTVRAACTKRDGTLLLGGSEGVSEYKGYNDNTNTYQFRYFSSYLDFQASSNLKFLKKLNITIIGGQGTTATLNWGYDYTSAYSAQTFEFRTAVVSEYNEDEYGLSNTVIAGSQGASTVTVEGSPDVHYTVDFQTTPTAEYNTEYPVYLDSDGYYYVDNDVGETRTLTTLYTKSADYDSEYNASIIIQKPQVNTSGSGTVVQIGLEAQINNAPFSIQKIDIHALLGRIV